MSFAKEFKKGLWDELPVLRVILGLCPTLAVTTSVENALGMGAAATFVLFFSNLAVSSLRKLIPSEVRIPCYIIIAATFTTITDLVLNAFAHELHKNLGIFIPLIVVNCIILGRAEAFAGRNSVWLSIADAIGMGIGFTITLTILASCRELLGSGTLTIWGDLGFAVPNAKPMVLMILAPGGFITLGLLLAGMNKIQERLARARGVAYAPPPDFDCRHCLCCGKISKP